MADEKEKDLETLYMMKRRKRAFIFPLIIAAIFGFTAIVMLLWNAIVPEVIPSVNPITYWQAMGLLVLSKILFSGFGPKRGLHHHGDDRRFMGHQARLRKHWMQMSEEERAHFKDEWKRRCDSGNMHP